MSILQGVENPTYTEIRDVCLSAGFVTGVEVSRRKAVNLLPSLGSSLYLLNSLA